MPKFQLERSVLIQADAATVFSKVRDFKSWVLWSPWILAEPNCTLVYADDGKSYYWEGDIIGSGEMELLDAVEGKELHYRLTFLKPWKSTSSVSFYFDERNGETNTRWTMEGALPFFLFWMKKMMLAAISMDYDRGLLMLKDFVEQGAVPSKLEFSGHDTVEGFDYIGLERECGLKEISEMMPKDLKAVSERLSESGIVPSGKVLALYHTFDMTQGVTRYTIALPVERGVSCPEGLTRGSLPTLRTYAIRHRGPYRHLGNAWAAGMMHSRAKLFRQGKGAVPFEIYENDPCEVAEKDVLASIHFPMK